MALLKIIDADENDITYFDFGVLKPSAVSETKQLIVRNISEYDIHDIGIRGVISPHQQGANVDTVGSLFISTDGSKFFNAIKINLKSNEQQSIYIKWQPTWEARQMKYRWTLQIELEYESMIPVDKNLYLSVPIPYSIGQEYHAC